MANSVGTLAGSLILQRALELVFTKRPVLNQVSFGFKDKDGGFTAKLGQTVYTRLKTVPTVNTFGTGATAFNTTDVPILIDQFKEVHHAFTPTEINSTDRNLVDESAEPMAVAIANHLVDALAARWIAANFANSSVVAAGWSYTNTMLVLQAALDGRGVSESGRFFTYASAVKASLLADSLIVAEFNNAANANAITTGKLPRVVGFGMQDYPALPNTGNMVGFAGTPDSTVYAVRAPQNPEEIAPGLKFPGVLGYVSEPKTGLTVMVNQWIDPTTLVVNNRLAFMYGTAKGNGNNGQILKTA